MSSWINQDWLRERLAEFYYESNDGEFRVALYTGGEPEITVNEIPAYTIQTVAELETEILDTALNSLGWSMTLAERYADTEGDLDAEHRLHYDPERDRHSTSYIDDALDADGYHGTIDSERAHP